MSDWLTEITKVPLERHLVGLWLVIMHVSPDCLGITEFVNYRHVGGWPSFPA
jgi:hypothetical protein